MSPFNVLQAISQAEMYQKVSTRAFVAFSEDEINSFKYALKLNMPRIIQDDGENARWLGLRYLCLQSVNGF
jgi:hypothetical protein